MKSSWEPTRFPLIPAAAGIQLLGPAFAGTSRPSRYSLNARRGAALAQEIKEFDAVTQPPLHHLRTADHFADDLRKLQAINALFSTKAAGCASQVGYQNERISRRA